MEFDNSSMSSTTAGDNLIAGVAAIANHTIDDSDDDTKIDNFYANSNPIDAVVLDSEQFNQILSNSNLNNLDNLKAALLAEKEKLQKNTKKKKKSRKPKHHTSDTVIAIPMDSTVPQLTHDPQMLHQSLSHNASIDLTTPHSGATSSTIANNTPSARKNRRRRAKNPNTGAAGIGEMTDSVTPSVGSVASRSNRRNHSKSRSNRRKSNKQPIDLQSIASSTAATWDNVSGDDMSSAIDETVIDSDSASIASSSKRNSRRSKSKSRKNKKKASKSKKKSSKKNKSSRKASPDEIDKIFISSDEDEEPLPALPTHDDSSSDSDNDITMLDHTVARITTGGKKSAPSASSRKKNTKKNKRSKYPNIQEVTPEMARAMEILNQPVREEPLDVNFNEHEYSDMLHSLTDSELHKEKTKLRKAKFEETQIIDAMIQTGSTFPPGTMDVTLQPSEVPPISDLNLPQNGLDALSHDGGGLEDLDLGKLQDVSTADLINQFKNLIEDEGDDATADPLGMEQTGTYQGEEDPGKVYCLCRKPYDATHPMICCDFCEEWYHCKCLGITDEELKLFENDRWKCQTCVALEAGLPPPTAPVVAAGVAASAQAAVESILKSTTERRTSPRRKRTGNRRSMFESDEDDDDDEFLPPAEKRKMKEKEQALENANLELKQKLEAETKKRKQQKSKYKTEIEALKAQLEAANKKHRSKLKKCKEKTHEIVQRRQQEFKEESKAMSKEMKEMKDECEGLRSNVTVLLSEKEKMERSKQTQAKKLKDVKEQNKSLKNEKAADKVNLENQFKNIQIQYEQQVKSLLAAEKKKADDEKQQIQLLYEKTLEDAQRARQLYTNEKETRFREATTAQQRHRVYEEKNKELLESARKNHEEWNKQLISAQNAAQTYKQYAVDVHHSLLQHKDQLQTTKDQLAKITEAQLQMANAQQQQQQRQHNQMNYNMAADMQSVQQSLNHTQMPAIPTQPRISNHITPQPPTPARTPPTPEHLKFSDFDNERLHMCRALFQWLSESPTVGSKDALANHLQVSMDKFTSWIENGDCHWIINDPDNKAPGVDGQVSLQHIQQVLHNIQTSMQSAIGDFNAKATQMPRTDEQQTYVTALTRALQTFDVAYKQYYGNIFRNAARTILNETKPGDFIEINKAMFDGKKLKHPSQDLIELEKVEWDPIRVQVVKIDPRTDSNSQGSGSSDDILGSLTVQCGSQQSNINVDPQLVRMLPRNERRPSQQSQQASSTEMNAFNMQSTTNTTNQPFLQNGSQQLNSHSQGTASQNGSQMSAHGSLLAQPPDATSFFSQPSQPQPQSQPQHLTSSSASTALPTMPIFNTDLFNPLQPQPPQQQPQLSSSQHSQPANILSTLDGMSGVTTQPQPTSQTIPTAASVMNEIPQRGRRRHSKRSSSPKLNGVSHKKKRKHSQSNSQSVESDSDDSVDSSVIGDDSAPVQVAAKRRRGRPPKNSGVARDNVSITPSLSIASGGNTNRKSNKKRKRSPPLTSSPNSASHHRASKRQRTHHSQPHPFTDIQSQHIPYSDAMLPATTTSTTTTTTLATTTRRNRSKRRSAIDNDDDIDVVDGSKDANDSKCRICQCPGELLCCEGCPAVFHRDCLNPKPNQSWIDKIADWYCPVCAVGFFHVPLIHKHTREKLAPIHEPLLKDLAAFLKVNPEYEKDFDPIQHPPRKSSKQTVNLQTHTQSRV